MIMQSGIFLLTLVSFTRGQGQLFNPLNYLDQLPSLKLPYVNNVPIPNIHLAHIIKPTPTVTTKVINVVTKYVSRNPVCIKSTGKRKPPCGKDNQKGYANEHLITKEYFVHHNREAKQSQSRTSIEEEHLKRLKQEIDAYKNIVTIGSRKSNSSNASSSSSFNKESIESSEMTQDHHHRQMREVEEDRRTPNLENRKLITSGNGNTNEELKDLLIEDRLDRLEDMLPHYTRMRVYQTSTITVTRTKMARLATATLMVKNCVPDGIDYCKTRTSGNTNKKKKRKSKVAVEQTPIMPHYSPYYYG